MSDINGKLRPFVDLTHINRTRRELDTDRVKAFETAMQSHIDQCRDSLKI